MGKFDLVQYATVFLMHNPHKKVDIRTVTQEKVRNYKGQQQDDGNVEFSTHILVTQFVSINSSYYTSAKSK
jgi:hypothetical protein